MKNDNRPLFKERWGCDAILCDLDGVITDTAHLHAKSWKKMFDEYLKHRASREGSAFQPFTIEGDYRRYVDGKPRYDGVRDFLESRSIALPYGDPSDPPDKETICGLGNRKNEYFNTLLHEEGAEILHPSVDWVRRQKEQGVRIGVVSSSKNTPTVLKTAGLEDLFEVRVDGNEGARLKLDGKPAPDYFVEAADRLGIPPERSAMVEDAVSGVQAGKLGGFRLVIGVDQRGKPEELLQHGAHVVVKNLAEMDELDPAKVLGTHASG